MNKDSLIKASEELMRALKNVEIDNVDKLELMINLNILLDENNYENHIKVLRKDCKNRRRDNK